MSDKPQEAHNLLRGRHVKRMADENLIEWVAALAHEGKEDWGFLKDEILRRIASRGDRR